jgi:hypothetical protein
MISKVLCDVFFSRNQPLKAFDNHNIRILKKIYIKIKDFSCVIKKKIRTCDLNQVSEPWNM